MDKKKKIAVIGHFGFGLDMTDGQTVKTKTVTRALEQRYSPEQVLKCDTHGALRSLLLMPFTILRVLRRCQNIIILPAQRGLKVIVPLLSILNRFFCRKTYYVVIGGWLPELLINNKRLLSYCRKLNGIFVETERMKNSLQNLGLTNVLIMKNYKYTSPISHPRKDTARHLPIRTCTFSRVIREKGIENAVNVVKAINARYQDEIYSLDIYGAVSEDYRPVFEALKREFPEFIQYKGTVDPDISASVISGYDILLFPTYYEGEGLAGTLIDAFSAATPVVASDWKYNSEIVRHKETGFLFKTHDDDAFLGILDDIYQQRYDLGIISENCLQEAMKYTPDNATRELFQLIDESL